MITITWKVGKTFQKISRGLNYLIKIAPATITMGATFGFMVGLFKEEFPPTDLMTLRIFGHVCIYSFIVFFWPITMPLIGAFSLFIVLKPSPRWSGK